MTDLRERGPGSGGHGAHDGAGHPTASTEHPSPDQALVSEQRNKRKIAPYEPPSVRARKAALLERRTPVVSKALDGATQPRVPVVASLVRRVDALEARLADLLGKLGEA